MVKYLKNKEGFVSVEAVISMVTFLCMTLLCIGFFTYTYPKIFLEKEVHLLAQKAKIQGGLTYEDENLFKSELEKRGYNRKNIVLTAVCGNKNALGVDKIGSSGKNYIKRTELEPIVINVSIPANKKLLEGPFLHFALTSTLSDTYHFRETVLSERW